MADVSVSMGVTGKETVTGAFQEVGNAGKQLGDAMMEHTKKLAELFLGYQAVVKAVEAFRGALSMGGQLNDLADQTGISAGKLVILQRAFENNGLAADELGKFVNKMQKFIEGAGDAGSASAEKLAKIGLTSEELKKMAPDEQFRAIGKAIAAIEDPTARAALSMEIFGKTGGKTLALFHDMDNSIAEAKGEVGSLANVMDASAESFNQVDDSFKEIANKVIEFAAGILQDAMPALKTLTDYLKNVDATAFGQTFSAAFSKGIDISLSIFRDPGNLFLAFGESLIYAFKQGINALDSGLVYVFQFAGNVIRELLPNAAKLFEDSFNAAVGFVLSGLTKMLSELFLGIAGYLPEQFAKPLDQIGKKLNSLSDEASGRYTTDMANAGDRISIALAKASEQTHFQMQDYMDSKTSAEIIAQRLKDGAESGRSFREEMAESVESTKAMSKLSETIAQNGQNFMNSIVGGATNIHDFMAQGGASGDLATMSGLKPYTAPSNVGPIAAPSEAGSSRSSGRSSSRSSSGPVLSDNQAANRTAADFSAYANSSQFGDAAYNGNDVSNRDTVVANLASALSRDANRSGNDITFSDAKDMAAKMYDDQFNKNKGPQDTGGNGLGSGGGSGSRPAPADPMAGIAKTISDIYSYMKQSLPQHALS